MNPAKVRRTNERGRSGVIGLMLAPEARVVGFRPYGRTCPRPWCPVDGSQRRSSSLTVANFAKGLASPMSPASSRCREGTKAEQVERAPEGRPEASVRRQRIELVCNDKSRRVRFNAYSLCGAGGDAWPARTWWWPMATADSAVSDRGTVCWKRDRTTSCSQLDVPVGPRRGAGERRYAAPMHRSWIDPDHEVDGSGTGCGGIHRRPVWLPSTGRPDLTSALEATFTRDPEPVLRGWLSEMVSQGSRIGRCPTDPGDLDWSLRSTTLMTWRVRSGGSRCHCRAHGSRRPCTSTFARGSLADLAGGAG